MKKKLIATLLAVLLSVAAAPLMAFAHGGGQDPSLAGPEEPRVSGGE